MERATLSADDMSYHLAWAPKYSIGKAAGTPKAVSAGEIRKGLPRVKRELRSGRSWEDGDFARTVGGKVATTAITRSIRFSEERRKQPEPLQSD